MSSDPELQFLAGGGEMGARIRAMDWTRSPLGPPQQWPQSLRSAISILLPSKAQIALCWGEDSIILYNDAYRPVFGAKHPGALGKPIREAWDELWRAGLKELFEGVRSTGEAFWAKDRPFFMERHGYLEETYFDVSYDPVRDESGQVGGLFCIVSETTGRVIGERRLRTLRDLGQVAQRAQAVDDVYTAAAEVLGANAHDVPFALLYAASPGDGPARLLGRHGLDAHPGATPAELPPAGGTWPLSGGMRILRSEQLAHLGPLHGGPWPEAVCQVAVMPFAPADQPSVGWLVAGVSPRRRIDDDYRDFLRLVASNIGAAVASVRRSEDERRRARMLTELDRAKTAFFSNVSHEFRTPLTLMLGPMEDALADRAHPLPDAQRERLDLARRSALRLQKLVNALLGFSRIEAGRARARYAPTDLAASTAELASGFRSTIEKAGLRLVVDCPALPQTVYVDRDMWEQVVLNLVSNAFKFTFEGEIAVRLRADGDAAELTVRDTGTGIREEDLPRVFERFGRIEGARSRTHEGTGIGLALVQELARLHGGSVAVQSALGAGSTFTVRIPFGREHLPADAVIDPGEARTQGWAASFVEEALRWLPDAPPAPAAPDALAPKATALPVSPRGRVLLADDNADMRAYVARLLAPFHDVQTVADGEEALAAVRRQPPDLVLADIMMPRRSGLELVHALRADPATAELPVILLSARSGEEARIEGLLAGADDYLEKPFGARELLARVAARLEIARVREQAEERLRESDRRKDEFISILAHELRNPLAPLRNAVHLLRSGRLGPQEAVKLHEMLDRQLAHLVRLVDDLLEMSRISRGDFELRQQPVDVAAVLHHAVETSEPLIREAGHALELDVPAEPLAVQGDPVRLAQIVANLLNNAARYTDRGGRIALLARREGDQVAVRVRDNGIGFDPAGAPRLFEMFTRGERSSGLGIGLALAAKLARMHQGSLEAHSDGPGRGAEFTLRLPLAQAAEPQSRPRRAGEASLGPIRVLVVDDNRDAAETLDMLLRVLGADVQVAHDGPQAIAAFEPFDPDVVLLDIGMPGMDGYEVARTLRARHAGHRARMIALTGWGQETDRLRGRAAGFDHHLVKPADIAALESLLADAARTG